MHYGVVMFPTEYSMAPDELARALEERCSTVPLIFVTGHSSKAPTLVHRTLAKPFTEDVLLREIRQVLDA